MESWLIPLAPASPGQDETSVELPKELNPCSKILPMLAMLATPKKLLMLPLQSGGTADDDDADVESVPVRADADDADFEAGRFAGGCAADCRRRGPMAATHGTSNESDKLAWLLKRERMVGVPFQLNLGALSVR